MGGRLQREQPEKELRVLFIGTGSQRDLATALELGRWPDGETPTEGADGLGLIEYSAQRTTLLTKVIDVILPPLWETFYATSDVIVFVMHETEAQALDTWESVIMSREAWLAKLIPVVISSSKSTSAVAARLEKEVQGAVTMRQLIYVHPRKSAGDLGQLRDSICLARRRPEPPQADPPQAATSVCDAPAPAPSPVVAPTDAPSDGSMPQEAAAAACDAPPPAPSLVVVPTDALSDGSMPQEEAAAACDAPLPAPSPVVVPAVAPSDGCMPQERNRVSV